MRLQNRLIVDCERIVGKVFGVAGAMAYQLAARPYDEPPVYGFKSEVEAYIAAALVLTQRSPARVREN